jgi:hypothetical protein
MMSLAILNKFITVASKHGTPVQFLRRVISDYDIKFKSGTGSDNVSQFWNEMRLYRNTVIGLQRPPLADSGAVLNLYHEATHAVMDLDDAGEESWFKRAEQYYDGAPLSNGDTVSKTEIVVDEVCGTYVGHRAVTVWNAWKRLDFLSEVTLLVAKGKKSVDEGKRLILLNSVPIAVEYDQKMKERVFGYEPDGGEQAQVQKDIYPGIRPYCDRLLENKIFDQFHQMTQLRLNYETLFKSMRSFPSIAKAMGGPNGYG